MSDALDAACRIWVIDQRVDASTFERLGDARELADAGADRVGVLIAGPHGDPAELIAAGADLVKIAEPAESADAGATRGSRAEAVRCGARARVSLAEAALAPQRPRVVLASGGPDGREWAARLALRRGWRLISPALRAELGRDGRLSVTALSACGRYARRATLGADETAVLTLKPGVAEALPRDPNRRGAVERIHSHAAFDEPTRVEREIPADPAVVDIRYADRIVAGGRGLGGAEEFRRLSRVAAALGAAVAASRVAVDLGWIERERQVGQTGKTVAPSLYLACGISGASHHLAGIADARHVVAINTDPDAPIFKAAHLGLVADLHEVLSQLEAQLAARSGGTR